MGFRLAAAYLLTSWLTVYGVLQVIPFVGYRLESVIDGLWEGPTQWVGIHIVHLSGVAAQFHSSDSRDTALAWITAGLVIPVSMFIAGIWSILDRQRHEYRTISLWLRYVLRLALVFLMTRYAIMKIFPLQMLPPSLAVLNEPVGNMSPMTLLWTTLGLHPAYEMLTGWIEGVAAILLVFRRTALLGTLLTAVVMTNVLLYNLFFDVPVKLGAANVLVLALAILVPDIEALWRLFILHQPASLSSQWVPTVNRPFAQLAIRAGELAFIAFALIQYLPASASEYARIQTSLMKPSPLTGVWHVDSALREIDGTAKATPVLTGLGQPMTELILEPSGMAMARSADGMLWRAQASIDVEKHTFELGSGYFEGVRFDATYSFMQPDAQHLVLRPIGKAAGANGTLTLSRMQTMSHYPLLDQRFRWVNEWALER